MPVPSPDKREDCVRKSIQCQICVKSNMRLYPLWWSTGKWGRRHKKIASFTSLCSTISVLFHFKYYLYTKQNQKNPTFYNYNKSDFFFCFVFLQNHFRQRDPRKFIMLIIRVSCNQSSSFIIKAIPKIKLHPVSQFFFMHLSFPDLDCNNDNSQSAFLVQRVTHFPTCSCALM